jgi:uncharacterized protein (TIGR03067 family)
MKARLLLVCVVLFGLTAFAPAPFPRPRRASQDPVAVARIQGSWTILKLEMTNDKGGKADQGNYLSEIRIENNRWHFVYRNPGTKPVTYVLAIDANATPASIDLTREGESKPYGIGIIVRKGDSIRMLYSFGKQRPTSFDNPPGGYWLLTLERKR